MFRSHWLRRDLRMSLAGMQAITFTQKIPRTPLTWRALSVLFILAAGLARTGSAQSQPAVPSVLKGRLVNASSAGVANAIVQWSIVGGSPISGITDARGRFAFEIPLSVPTQVEVSAIANLYNPAQASVQLQKATVSAP